MVKHVILWKLKEELTAEEKENGEYPEDYDLLGEIVKNISYYNAVNYFGFDLK